MFPSSGTDTWHVEIWIWYHTWRIYKWPGFDPWFIDDCSLHTFWISRFLALVLQNMMHRITNWLVESKVGNFSFMCLTVYFYVVHEANFNYWGNKWMKDFSTTISKRIWIIIFLLTLFNWSFFLCLVKSKSVQVPLNLI